MIDFSFRTWYEAAFSRNLMRQYPELPDYVKKDVIKHGPGYEYSYRKKMGQLGDLQVDKSRLDYLNSLNWSKKPQVVQIVPSSFDHRSLQYIIDHKFGNTPSNVVNDEERTAKQREKATNDGDNEPVVYLLDPYGKYAILEGWHRTMAILLLGCPPNQREYLEDWQIYTRHRDPSKDLNKLLDFSKWTPVKIKAYIATENKQR